MWEHSLSTHLRSLEGGSGSVQLHKHSQGLTPKGAEYLRVTYPSLETEMPTLPQHTPEPRYPGREIKDSNKAQVLTVDFFYIKLV